MLKRRSSSAAQTHHFLCLVCTCLRGKPPTPHAPHPTHHFPFLAPRSPLPPSHFPIWWRKMGGGPSWQRCRKSVRSRKLSQFNNIFINQAAAVLRSSQLFPRFSSLFLAFPCFSLLFSALLPPEELAKKKKGLNSRLRGRLRGQGRIWILVSAFVVPLSIFCGDSSCSEFHFPQHFLLPPLPPKPF